MKITYSPKISIIMAVYNGEPYLGEAVESICGQTHSDFEFIIINDASEDRSAQLIKGYSAVDTRILLINNSVNLGLAASLNKAMARARGNYIARMDADDISLPDRLACQVNYMEQRPEVGVLGGAIQIIDGDGNPIRIVQYPTEHSLLVWLLFFDNPFAHPSIMMRREVLLHTGGYNTHLSTSQDFELWHRASKITRFANLENVVIKRRCHHKNVSVVKNHLQYDNSAKISHQAIEEFLKGRVSIQLVRRLLKHFSKPRFTTGGEVYQAGFLIYRLCLAFLQKSNLHSSEKKRIRQSAAEQLYLLARMNIHLVQTWWIFFWISCLDPQWVGRLIQRFYSRDTFMK